MSFWMAHVISRTSCAITEHTALTSRPLSRYWIQKIFNPVLPTGSRAQKARLYLGVFSLEQEFE